MTRVFVSYSPEDNYFVDFLIELLKFHRVDVWIDRSDLRAGATFTSEIEQALASCDCLLVVVSHHSSRSRWITREISTFEAMHPDRAVIPLVLEAGVDVDEIYDGLGQVKQLRLHESMLESFRELLRLLGHPLFPMVENRQTPDRRSGERRHGERRTGPIERRLRVGIWQGYSRATGRSEFEPLDRIGDVGRLARFLAEANSPLDSFDFADRETGEHVRPGFEDLQAMAFKSWQSNMDEQLIGAVYIIDDIISELMACYVVTSTTRRAGDRRSGTSRRRDADPDA